ncbi:uncharacterized protein LOC143545847 [Bidens hawaiensis]|uniref:uncharacterized protein LOC143545847 n=1 Tax=Bidens hawaiensis TaxID=980011 RepID=UPI00404B2BBF
MGRMMVEIPIPPRWKQLWDTWDLRGFIILSISLQTFLIFVAPFRKRTKKNWVVMPLWIAYLLADWAANFAVGLISNSQGNPDEAPGKKNRNSVENEDLLAFWAPFLLVHLGGPDTITAFALEDNELWLRHLLGLVFQCIAAVYVFVQSLPHNGLWIPTMLMFMTGIIKYVERTRSLYLASADRFKEIILTEADPGSNYAKMMGEYKSKKEAKLPTSIEIVKDSTTGATVSANKAKKGQLTKLEVVQYGFQFYEKFRGLIVDMIFSRKERNQSRDFFLNRNPGDAFKVVEVELNFIYEVLFTKLPVVYGRIGFISRFFALATVCLAIVLFIMKGKSNYHPGDVTITYGLLFGALVLDLSALFMLLFSDWTIISLRKSPDLEPDNSLKSRFITSVLTLRTLGTLQPSKNPTEQKKVNYLAKCMPIMKRRWSETISTFNLIDYCLHPLARPYQKVFDKLGIIGFIDSIVFVDSKKFFEKLRDFIFNELKSKSELADDLETSKEISSARGDWVLRVEDGWSGLLKYVGGVDYDQSIIQWHIATELCYNAKLHDEKNNKGIPESEKEKLDRENSKLLSDYMLYLLMMQSSMMSAVAGIAQIRFKDTCAETERFFGDVKSSKESASQNKNGDEHIQACMDILNVSTDVEPVAIKGDRSKSLLFDGCILAKELMKIDEIKPKEPKTKLNKWGILSKVWVELLCYAASHTRASMQAAQVSKGGELITIVWLLMTHFGLGDQFQISEGPKRAKLIVGK